MGCINCVKAQGWKTIVPMFGDTIEENFDEKRRSKTDISKFLLKFPRIKKAYQHLFTAWRRTLGKQRPKGTKAIFDLSGRKTDVPKALSCCGIVVSDEHIASGLSISESATEESKDQIITFRDVILCLNRLIMKKDSMILTKSEDAFLNEKYDDIMLAFKVVRDMFLQIDVDKSGEITLEELQKAFTGLGNAKLCQQRMKELDFNNDRLISYPEFCVGISVWAGFAEEFDE